jgi:Uma2 family endonuclease
LSIAPELFAPPPESDPFRYGWRDVRVRQPDGSFLHTQKPLTLWDVLHPQEGDTIVQGLRHAKDCQYLFTVLSARPGADPHTLVFHDTPVYWDVPGLSHHCPDVSVIFDVQRERDDWPSFHVAYEGVRPTVLFEVVSPATRANDVTAKVAEYHAAQVPWYVIVDREREDDWPTIVGYRWTPDGYEPVALDSQRLLHIEPLGLKLGTIQNRIVLYDAETGAELGDYAAISEALEAEARARQAAEEAARLAQEEARKADERAQKADDRAREADTRARKAADLAKAAEQRALDEANLRGQLEQRLRELEARLAGPGDAAAPPA